MEERARNEVEAEILLPDPLSAELARLRDEFDHLLEVEDVLIERRVQLQVRLVQIARRAQEEDGIAPGDARELAYISRYAELVGLTDLDPQRP